MIILDFKEGCNYTMIVEADRYRIRQVLVNLISNSIKYGKQNGKTQLCMYDMDENVLIDFTYNVIFFSPEHLPRYRICTLFNSIPLFSSRIPSSSFFLFFFFFFFSFLFFFFFFLFFFFF